MTTYVLDGVEVKLTGRKASKEVKSSMGLSGGKIQELHEITPVDTFNGEWKKWVRMEDLFEVQS